MLLRYILLISVEDMLLNFLRELSIIRSTWPVSQTVKTLRSQRREYGFESHTGHQRKRSDKLLFYFLLAEFLLYLVIHFVCDII